MLLSKQFLLWNSTASLRCWKWNIIYPIGFWNGPNQVWTLLSEQKLQRNLLLVKYLFKSKGSVTNYITDGASVHTGNASEQFLHHNRTLIPVHTVPEQLLKRSKNLSSIQCEHSQNFTDSFSTVAVAQWVTHWNSDYRVVQAEGSSPGGDIYQNFSNWLQWYSDVG